MSKKSKPSKAAVNKAFMAKIKTLQLSVKSTHTVEAGPVLTGKKLQAWSEEQGVPMKAQMDCGECGGGTATLIAAQNIKVCRRKHDGSGEVEVTE